MHTKALANLIESIIEDRYSIVWNFGQRLATIKSNFCTFIEEYKYQDYR